MNKKWTFVFSVLIIVALVVFERKQNGVRLNPKNTVPDLPPSAEAVWIAPDTNTIPSNETGWLIRYGKKLISHTSFYFGPKGKISHQANGMNCENCHIDAGTKAWAGNFGSTASLYPKFSERKNAVETIYQRIRDCFERSLNGVAPDSNGVESKAMASYILWLGKDVPTGKKARGTGLEILSFLEVAADSAKGKIIYTQKCISCHKANGEGQMKNDAEFLYPPLWGPNSYNTSAGLYRLSKFAGFIKDNMPYGVNYATEILTNEEAWNLAAYVNSQRRPVKLFKDDWPDLRRKSFDVPYGPYIDTYSEHQHKYGPFIPIVHK
jgi:thiosulfate dehydrogenase